MFYNKTSDRKARFTQQPFHNGHNTPKHTTQHHNKSTRQILVRQCTRERRLGPTRPRMPPSLLLFLLLLLLPLKSHERGCSGSPSPMGGSSGGYQWRGSGRDKLLYRDRTPRLPYPQISDASERAAPLWTLLKLWRGL